MKYGMGFMKLFGSSGIRGVVNKEVTPELALQVGLVSGKSEKDRGYRERPQNFGAYDRARPGRRADCSRL